MDRFALVTFILSVAASSLAAVPKVKHYRPDYEYNPKTDAFYKIHTESVSSFDAKATCEEEAAAMMQPLPQDLAYAHGMLKQFPDLADSVWIADDGKEYPVSDQIPDLSYQSLFTFRTPLRLNISRDSRRCVGMNRTGDVEVLQCMQSLPFICKVEAKEAPYDPHCKVYSKEYKYYESVGSCYKFSHAAYSWDQAYDECLAEGAHLIILNSELEHQLIFNLTQTAPVVAAQSSWSWYAGIRAKKPVNGSAVVFKTIFGQTLEEAGYAEWAQGEPNNAGNNEYCGSIFKNEGKYNDLRCSHLYAFICENEISNEVN